MNIIIPKGGFNVARSKAMVLSEPKVMHLREFDIPDVKPDGMLFKVEMTGICGSDLLLYTGRHRFTSFPKILGHEVSGYVEKIGSEAAKYYGVKEGDQVSIEPYLFCGKCKNCLTGDYGTCIERRSYGVAMTCDKPPHLFGGYSEYMYILPGSKVHKIADHVPAEAACMSSVIGNGVRWVRTKAQVKFGESVAIVGAGAQALCTVIAAKAAGAGQIIVIGMNVDSERLKLAKELGAHYTINAEDANVVEEVVNITGNEMVDVAIECAGAPKAVETVLDIVRKKGRVVLCGVSGGKIASIKTDLIVNNELSVLGGHGQSWDVEPAVDLINSNEFGIERIVSHLFPLEKANEAIQYFMGRTDPTTVRVGLTPLAWR